MENVEKQIKEVCRRFGIQGEYGRFEVIESGHINSTYKVFFSASANGKIISYRN